MIIRAQNLALPGDADANAPMFGINNVVPDGSLAVDGAADGYPLSNLINPATFLKWQHDDAAEALITLTTASAYIDYVGIATHNLGTVGSTVKIQGDEGGGAGWEDLAATHLPPNDEPIIVQFNRFQYVGVRIVLGAASAAQEIAVVYMGDSLLSQRNIYVGHRPITLNPQVEVINGLSAGGHFLGSIIISERRVTQIQLEHLTPMWVRGDLRPFLDEAKSRPFFFAWRPSSYPREVGYVSLDGNPELVNMMSNGLMSASINVTGYV